MAKNNKQKTRPPGDDKDFPLPIYKEEDDIYRREKEVPFLF